MQRFFFRIATALFIMAILSVSGCVLVAGSSPEDSYDYYGENYDDNEIDDDPYQHQGGDPYDWYFHSRLSRHGEWIILPGFGPVWRPFVVQSWVPYKFGFWARSGSDWIWISYEPFGDIVYHYGNWGYVNPYGWCWFPGNQWAPHHVDWVEWQGSVGWYPRIPRVNVQIKLEIHPRWEHYVWVPKKHFLDRDFYRHHDPDLPKRWTGSKEPERRNEIPTVSTVEKWTGKTAPTVQSQEIHHKTRHGDVKVWVPDQKTRDYVRRDGSKIVSPWLSPKEDKKQKEKQEKKDKSKDWSKK